MWLHSYWQVVAGHCIVCIKCVCRKMSLTKYVWQKVLDKVYMYRVSQKNASQGEAKHLTKKRFFFGTPGIRHFMLQISSFLLDQATACCHNL